MTQPFPVPKEALADTAQRQEPEQTLKTGPSLKRLEWEAIQKTLEENDGNLGERPPINNAPPGIVKTMTKATEPQRIGLGP